MKFSRFLASRDVIKQKNLYNIKQAKALLKPTGKPAIARPAAKKETPNSLRETAANALPPYASQGPINPRLIDTERKMMTYLRKKDELAADLQKKVSNAAKAGETNRKTIQDNFESKGHVDNGLDVPYEGSSKAIFKAGKTTVDDIASNPKALSGKSADEIAQMLRDAGYDVTVQASKKSTSGAKIIIINNPGEGRNITQVQVSPGGGRHGTNPYVKISTSDQGIVKVVDGAEATYKSDGSETAKIIFMGGQ